MQNTTALDGQAPRLVTNYPVTIHRETEAAISEESRRFEQDYTGRNRDQRKQDEDVVRNP